jgi:hypothetical protein
MARMTIDRSAQERAKSALVAATAAYSDALDQVKVARLAQRAAIIDARAEDVRQVDVTTLTITPDRPKGFTREHIRRIEEDHRKRQAWGVRTGLDVDDMSTADILQIPLPDEETTPTRRNALDDDDDDDAAADTDEDAEDAEDTDEDADDDEDAPAGVLA